MSFPLLIYSLITDDVRFSFFLFLRESPSLLSLHLPLTSSISPFYLIPWMGSRISRHLSKKKEVREKLERERERGRERIDQMKEREKRNWKQGAHLQFKYKNFPQFVCYLFTFPSILFLFLPFSLFLSFFHSDYFFPSFSVHFFSFFISWIERLYHFFSPSLLFTHKRK